MKKERINEIWGVVFLLLGLFSLAALIFYTKADIPFYTAHPNVPVKNYTGIIGAYTAFGLFFAVGYSAYLIPVIFLLWSACFFMQQVPEKKFFKLVGLGIALCATSSLIAIMTSVDTRMDASGVVGYLSGTHLLRYFGQVGSFFLAASCMLLSLLLATDFLIYPMVTGLFSGSTSFWKAMFEKSGQLKDETFVFFSRLKFWKRDEEYDEEEEDEDEYEDEEEDDEEEEDVKGKKGKKIKTRRLADLDGTPIKVKKYRPDVPEGEEGALPTKAELAKQAAKNKVEQEDEEEYEDEDDEEEYEDEEYEDDDEEYEDEDEEDDEDEEYDEDEEELEEDEDAGEEKDEAQVISAPKSKEPSPFEGVIGASAEGLKNYKLPKTDLLLRPKAAVIADDNLQENSKILENTLAEFGIEVKVVEVEQGPVITRYELLPAPGVKVNSIAALSDDISLALKATSVRLIIPIPGKSAVGVEVPNSVSSPVSLREMMESQAFRATKHKLPLVLGKDTSGKSLIADLTTMPHMLIAGTTGSGKTVCVNAIVMGLLYHCPPDELKFIMVDPKMVELACYNKIPHMLAPVVTDVKKAAHTLNWVVAEMENRYRLLAAVGVRNIAAFNSRDMSESALNEVEGKEESEGVVPARLPYIVVIIDELADLMMVAQDKVESAIARLAQLSRAVGIHLILATQRPSVDVITGVIKANFPARISFKVASKVDSRTVLDANGADRLLGKGDMLFIQPGDDQPTRGQAAFVTDDEINGVVKHVAEQDEPDYHDEIAEVQAGKNAQNPALEKDEIYDQAVDIVLQTGQASTSNLQRRLRLGYTRAARIIDQMEAHGVIGPSQGAKPREILISRQPAGE